MIRVLLADDEELIRAGLRTMVEADDELTVVAETRNGDETVNAARQHRPDVALLDIRMPGCDGLAAARAIRHLPEPPKVIMLTTFDLDEYVYAALRAGASGFLLKDSPPQELIRAIHVVAAGQAMLSPAATQRLISVFSEQDSPIGAQARQRVSALTDREREVLVQIGQGLSNAEIGRAMRVSQATVKAHVSHVFAKLNLTNRVQAAILARDADLLPRP